MTDFIPIIRNATKNVKTQYEREYDFGMDGEALVTETLRRCLDPTLKKTGSKYDIIDFEGDKIRVEHKRRTCTSGAFDETLMPCSKGVKGDKPLYFSFGFTDGVYIIPYEEHIFKNVRVDMFCRHLRTGFKDVPKPYFYIPVHLLTCLT